MKSPMQRPFGVRKVGIISALVCLASLWLFFLPSCTPPIELACLETKECPASSPYCIAGKCRACRHNGDCDGSSLCVSFACLPHEGAATEKPTQANEHRPENKAELPSPERSKERPSFEETFDEVGTLELPSERTHERLPDRLPESFPEEKNEATQEKRPEPLKETTPEPPSCGGLCPGGFACQGNRCLSGCGKDSECRPNFLCHNSLCFAKAVSLSAGQPRQWADSTAAPDCMGYRFGQTPASPQSHGYEPSDVSGIYLIQPAGIAAAFPVYCEMQVRQGGWTLVLKADGSKPTFAYDAPLWTNPSQGPGTDPSLNATEALLPSYASVPLTQILVVMTEPGQTPRLTIASLEGSSLHQRLLDPAFQPFLRAEDLKAWLALTSNPSVDTACRMAGINLRIFPEQAYGLRLRMGLFANEFGKCNQDPSAFLGIGSQPAQGSPNPSIMPIVGHFASLKAPQGVRNLPAFAAVFVRRIQGRPYFFPNAQQAYSPIDGFLPPDCLHLPFLFASPTTLPDQTYLLHPPQVSAPFAAFCQMSHNDGGWTLALKADGSKPTFAYDAPLWTNPTQGPSDDPHFNQTEALLPSFASLPTRRLLVQMAPLPLSSPPTPSAFSSLVIRASSDGLAEIFKRSSYSGFAYPSGEAAWRSLLPGSALQPNRTCDKEGINVETGQTSGAMRGLRLGLVTDESPTCASPDSVLGFGARYNPNVPNLPPNLPSVGNFAMYNGAQSRSISAFGVLSLRDLVAAPASSADSDIVLVTRNGVAARERRNGDFETSCRAYRYPPHYKGPGAQSGLYRIQPTDPSQDDYITFCDQDTQGGGWTLLLKADGSLPTFSYGASLWTDSSVYHPDRPSFDLQEAKLRSAVFLPFSQLLIKMLPTGQTDLSKAAALRLEMRATSLVDLFRSSRASPFLHGAGRPAWKALLPNSSLQTFFAFEGANLFLDGSPRLRLGLSANNRTNAENADSYIGIGANALPYVGNLSSTQDPDNGIRTISAFAWLFAR